MPASDKVKFLTGLATNLDSTPKVKGQILFSIDSNNFGHIWYDKSSSVRVLMGEALSFKGDSVLSINKNATTGVTEFTHTGRGLVYTVVGTQTASTGTWTGRLDDLPNSSAVYDGLTILYYLPYAGSGNATLTLTFEDGSTLADIPVFENGTTRLTTHYPKGSTILLTYWSAPKIDGTAQSARWTRADYDSNSNTIPSAYCETAAATAAKTASCTNYALKPNSYIHVLFRYDNTAANALTLNINGKGAKPIFINETASSANNNTLPAGTYIAFYDGTNYYFRTDNLLPASIDGNAMTASEWQTARTFTIGNTGKSVDGSKNVSWTLAEIGAATSGHNHDSTYLKLDGSNNMTGDVNIIAGDTDKFVNFWYNTNKTAGASWRVGMLGSGSSDTNYFVIQSGTSTTSATAWNNAIRIGQNTYNVYLPSTTASTTTATGGLVVAGGVGVGGQVTATRLAANGSNTNYHLYVNGKSFLNGETTVAERFYAEKVINQILVGSGTAGRDGGTSDTNRYHPAQWTFNTDLTASNGDIITIKVPVVGHDYGVYLSIDSGANYYPVVLNGTTRVTTHYPVNTYIQLIFESTGSAASIYPLAGGTARATVTGGAWRVLNYYDSGNPGDWNLRQYTIKAQTALTAIHIIGGTDSGYNMVDSGTAFDIRYAVLYCGTALAANGTGNNNFIHHYSINVRNSSNSNISLTAYKNVYIKGTVSGVMFTPISGGNPYVQDITAADDGYVYYYIGRAYSTSAITFDTTGAKMYWYKDGAIRPYINEAALALKAMADASGNDLEATYISGISISGHTITYTYPNGNSGTFNTPDTDTKVNMVARSATTKAYLLGTTTSPTSSTQAVTSVAETGVYFDTSAATLVATTFKGKLDWSYIQSIPQIVEGGLITNTADTGITIQLYDLNGNPIGSSTAKTNGVLTIPAANGNGTNNVAGLVTTAAQTWSGIKTFASAIKAKNDNDFISHSNEFNFAPALTDNMEIHINHRTAGTNTSGKKITKYHFKDGNGSYAIVKASSFEGNLDWSNLLNVPQAVEGALGSQVTGQDSGNGYKIQLYDLNGNSISSSTSETNGVIVIPYASGDTIGLVSATAQTWKGNKTFSNNVSISGTLGVTGVATFNNTTEASSTTTAGVVVKGGIGIAKKMFIGDSIYFTGNEREIATYINSTTKYTWMSENHSSGGSELWVGAKDTADSVHLGELILHAGLSDATNAYIEQSLYAYIGTSATDSTGAKRKIVYTDASSNGSSTQPIYINSNGKVTQTTYSLSATIDAGTTNRMAYYSGNNKIEDAGSIYASADSLTINGTSAPINSGKFQVIGTSTMQNILPQATATYTLGSSTLGWKELNIDGTSAAGKIYLRNSETAYITAHIATAGTTSVTGVAELILGNDINGSGTRIAENAQGRLKVYNAATTAAYYYADSWHGNGLSSYTFLGATSSTANTAAYSYIIAGNAANVNSTTAHSEGRLRLYSAATSYHQIQGASTTVTHSHVLPNYSSSADTSWIAVGGNGSSTGVASSKQLMYLSTAGVLTASTENIGGVDPNGDKSGCPIYLKAGVVTQYPYHLLADLEDATQYGVAYYSLSDHVISTAAGTDHQLLQATTGAAPSWVDAFTDLSWSGEDTTSLTLNATVAGVTLNALVPVADGTANATVSGIITDTTQSIAGNKTFMDDTYVRNNLYVGTQGSSLGSVYFYTGNNYTTRLTMNSTSNVATNREVYIQNYDDDMYLVHTGSADAVGLAGSACPVKPVFVNTNGRLTAMCPCQYKEWSLSSGGTSVTLTSDYYTTETCVLSLVVTSGQAGLTGPITWNTTTAGQLVISTTKTTAAISGYVITATCTVIS